MTVSECAASLEKITDHAFDVFRTKFGGGFTTRQEYVDHFVHHPEHERQLCQLLGCETEQDKLTAATVASALAAAASASSARWAMIWAGLSVLVALAAVFLASPWSKSP